MTLDEALEVLDLRIAPRRDIQLYLKCPVTRDSDCVILCGVRALGTRQRSAVESRLVAAGFEWFADESGVDAAVMSLADDGIDDPTPTEVGERLHDAHEQE